MLIADPLALVGTTVSEKYEVERVVGEGGFAVVYRATHKVWNRPVALKVFRTMGDLPPDRRDQLVKSFIQEGALLAELSERSAAIVQARDVGMLRTKDGREMPFMVLEWLEGRTLEQVIELEKGAGLPPRTAMQALEILEPAAVALALAHKRNIAHRDVKPANIFVLGDPRGEYTVKMLDFGIAKVVQDMQRLGRAFAQTQGVISSFTPAYGAPEQFSRTHGATGPWTDVFSLALIFTELVTHEPALRGDDFTQLAFCSVDPKRRPTPRTYGADVPDAVEAVMRRALAVPPEERYQSMGELWEALRSALAMEPARAFGTTDSSRSGNVTALAPSGQVVMLPDSQPRGTAVMGSAPTPPPPPGNVPYRANRTLPTPGPAAVAPRGTGATPLLVTFGVAALLGVGVLAAGGYLFFARSKSVSMVASAAPVVASSAARLAPPPKPPATACPAGMAKIPGGKFFMGSDDKDDDKDQRPAHQVTLAPYCADITEVTVAAYKACSDHGECLRAPRENEWEGITAEDRKIYDPLCTARDPEVKAQHPINCVDWELATAFCAASGKRLPTEAEWEFATRGSDGRRYPWGDDDPKDGKHLNACGKECTAWAKKTGADVEGAMYPVDDGQATTAPVGSFPKGDSPFGLEDVVGNVWEWTADWYGPYDKGPDVDPKGPPDGTDKVIRGGSWNGSRIAWVRPTYRFKSTPKLRSHGIGFRCVKDLPR